MKAQTRKAKLAPYTLIYHSGSDSYHIAKTFKFFRGEKPPGIAVFRGEFGECLIELMK